MEFHSLAGPGDAGIAPEGPPDLEARLATPAGARDVALVRGRLEALLGPPDESGDEYKVSFAYGRIVRTGDTSCRLVVQDWKAAAVTCQWWAGPRDADPRGTLARVHAEFARVLSSTPPADYRDVFHYGEASGAAYGVARGEPWVEEPEAADAAGALRPRVHGPRRANRGGVAGLLCGVLAGAIVARPSGPAWGVACGIAVWTATSVGWRLLRDGGAGRGPAGASGDQ